MAFISRLLTTLGVLFLAHAGYSAHEHSVLYGGAHPVPLDISLETLVAIVLIIFGLVLGAEKPKPISWREWAGQIEKEGGLDNPFRNLEERISFLDIRAKRKEFAEWRKQQEEASAKQ